MIKKFESFDVDNSKVWIVGIPSGEAFQVSRKDIDSLYKERLIHYSTKYVNIGFYAFDDDDVELVKRYVDKKNVKKGEKDLLMFDNEFGEIIVDTILEIINKHEGKLDFYIQEDCFGINYGSYYYIEVTIGPNYYSLVKRFNGAVVDKYQIRTDALLIQRLDEELNGD